MPRWVSDTTRSDSGALAGLAHDAEPFRAQARDIWVKVRRGMGIAFAYSGFALFMGVLWIGSVRLQVGQILLNRRY